MLVLLANAATHDLIRWYPPEAAASTSAREASVGHRRSAGSWCCATSPGTGGPCIQAKVAVSLQLQALGGRLRDPGSTELLERLAVTATESVGRLRQLVFELRPPLLDEVGLAAAIDQYARRAGELAGFTAQVTDESRAWAWAPPSRPGFPAPRASERSSRRPGPARCR